MLPHNPDYCSYWKLHPITFNSFGPAFPEASPCACPCLRSIAIPCFTTSCRFNGTRYRVETGISYEEKEGTCCCHRSGLLRSPQLLPVQHSPELTVARSTQHLNSDVSCTAQALPRAERFNLSILPQPGMTLSFSIFNDTEDI